MRSKAWARVPRPRHRKAPCAKLVFKRKIEADGEVKRYKCRFGGQGFRQLPGLDYNESYAPTPTPASTRVLPAEAAMGDLELLYTTSTKRSFHPSSGGGGDMQYIHLPDTFLDFPVAVGKLNRSLHGIVQPSRNWNSLLTTELNKKGLEQPMSNPCVLRVLGKDGELEIIVVVHVDDLVVKSRSPETFRLFSIKDLGRSSITWVTTLRGTDIK